MILFNVIFFVSFAIAVGLMLRLKKRPNEIAVFVTLALLGFVVWILALLERPFKISLWIGWVIDRTGL
ncbi:hypothetical protein B1A99_26145 [Cohnella sp. CIP 111063]|jgi:uncharacterized membrane protein|uniref:hypothetical protein n=1 Tax=unclassified Cohnella TaxID=2636738 RepID=UPI000B8BDABB|nr:MULTISPECIES: hypothetical protein [unclassified Cohnella]OXS54438.1 hypothetical protein B1A99_26145 [Cohnella sp. CIP 111063]PRX63936.1 hypothetical protein B0G52_12031 [Cohnella sp. SGD-V74]